VVAKTEAEFDNILDWCLSPTMLTDIKAGLLIFCCEGRRSSHGDQIFRSNLDCLDRAFDDTFINNVKNPNKITIISQRFRNFAAYSNEEMNYGK